MTTLFLHLNFIFLPYPNRYGSFYDTVLEERFLTVYNIVPRGYERVFNSPRITHN